MYLDSYCRSEKKLLLLLLTITKIICLGSLDNFFHLFFFAEGKKIKEMV